MKIALIVVKEKVKDLGCENPPLGLLSLVSYLIGKKIIKKGDVKIIDTYFEDPQEELKNFSPDIVGFSAVTPFYLKALSVAKGMAKNFPKAVLILGGAHYSSNYSRLDKVFKIGVVGEGEDTFAEIVQKFKEKKKMDDSVLAGIRGIGYWNKTGKYVVNKSRSVIEDLNTIPPIDWSLLPRKRIVSTQLVFYKNRAILCKSISLYTSRGCPYNCTFCAYNNIWGRSRVRFFNPVYVGSMMEHLYKTYGITAFGILDDTFAITKERVSSLINELEKRKMLGKVFFFKVFIRANLVDAEMCELLDKLGVVSVFMGIESGSQKVLDFLKKGSLKLSEVREAIRLFIKHKIRYIGSFMFFSPGEKIRDIDMTLDFMRWFVKQKYALDANVCITTPYPGTEMWRMKETMLITKSYEKYLRLASITDSESEWNYFYKNGISKQRCDWYWKEANRISGVLVRKRSNMEWQFRIREMVLNLSLRVKRKIGIV